MEPSSNASKPPQPASPPTGFWAWWERTHWLMGQTPYHVGRMANTFDRFAGTFEVDFPRMANAAENFGNKDHGKSVGDGIGPNLERGLLYVSVAVAIGFLRKKPTVVKIITRRRQ